MGRVEGDNGVIASSTNSCGTALRCLTANRVSSSGTKAVLRRGFDMGVRIQRSLCRGTAESLYGAPSVAASRAMSSPQLQEVSDHGGHHGHWLLAHMYALGY